MMSLNELRIDRAYHAYENAMRDGENSYNAIGLTLEVAESLKSMNQISAEYFPRFEKGAIKAAAEAICEIAEGGTPLMDVRMSAREEYLKEAKAALEAVIEFLNEVHDENEDENYDHGGWEDH